MLNGKPRVDVDDLRAYCIYQGGRGKKKHMAPVDPVTASSDGGDEQFMVKEGQDYHEDDGTEASIKDSAVIEDDDSDFGDSHETVVWFWQCLREMSEHDSRAILSFFTGSSRVPVDGYEPPLNITEGLDMEMDALPKAHTCFNQIVLPRYSSCAKMKERLMFASMESQGFQFG